MAMASRKDPGQPRIASGLKWRKTTEWRGKREGGRIGEEEGGRCGKSDGDKEEEHHDHRETTVTKRTEISFNKNCFSSPTISVLKNENREFYGETSRRGG